jgi:hypothetical protein
MLEVRQLPKGFAPGVITLRIYEVKNPISVGATANFRVELMEQNIYTILFDNQTAGSFSVEPGTIGSVEISGKPLNINAEVEYSITFTPNNPIPQGGSIKIDFPSQYDSVVPNTCLIINGLNHIAEPDNVMSCVASGKSLVVSNFAEIKIA